MSTWINFKELRQKLRFADVLRHYKVEAKIRGDRATALCPLPGHVRRADERTRTASLSINLTRNIFQCFGCHKSGNVLDFACRMEGYDPSDNEQFRQAVVKIAEAFKINAKGSGGDSKEDRVRPAPQAVTASAPVINAPLDFELKDLDTEHPYLLERGFTSETIAHFGLGYCNRGLMKGRIAIPLHDLRGKLVGYAGRTTTDKLISDEHPKYRFPGSRLVNGVQHEFHKSLILYNAHRMKGPVDELFVVEGFPACWWLWQAKCRNVVALMGSDCSDAQADIIVDLVKPDGIVWAMPDNDDAGIHCASSILEKVARWLSVRYVKLRQGHKQPTDISANKLATIFGF